MRKNFEFLEDFKLMADKLPDDMRLKFYDAITNYAFFGIESDDPIIGALVIAVKSSLDKIDGRTNNGGNHNPKGVNQHKIDQKEVNSGQSLVNSGQSLVNSGQSLVNSGQSLVNSGQSLVNSGQSCSNLFEKEKEKEKQKERYPLEPPERINKNKNKNKNILYPLPVPHCLFGEFWEAYKPIKSSEGRFVAKGNRSACEKKYQKLLDEGEKHETIMRGLAEYLRYCQENDTLSCGAEVFLNQRRWETDYSNAGCLQAQGTKKCGRGNVSISEIAAEYIRETGTANGNDFYSIRNGVCA